MSSPDGPVEGIGEVLSRLEGTYTYVRELGRGGTSVVHLVHDHALDREVALKIIHPGLALFEEGRDRLLREARLVAQLAHPNIVRVYGTLQLSDGSLALMMEHVPGRNLKEALQRDGPFTVERTAHVLLDVASALAYAHRRRIVHRDVKPDNIYVDDEVRSARLADFGVARPWDSSAGLTVPGMVLGTPAYMAPERIEGRELDPRVDIYSLGVVGYELLTGAHPWEHESLYEILYKQKNEDLPPLEEVRPGIPPELRSLLERAVRKDPAGRWPTAEEMAIPLSRLVSRRAPVVVEGAELREAADYEARGSGKRSRAAVLAPVLILLLAAAASLVVGRSGTSAGEFDGFVEQTRSPALRGSEDRAEGAVAPRSSGIPATLEVMEGDRSSGEPTHISVTGGSGQSGAAESTLPERLIVVVTDSAGNPVSDVPVRFFTEGGSIEPATSLTDGAGRAAARWLLGPGPGVQTAVAGIAGGATARFEARALRRAEPPSLSPAGGTVEEAPSPVDLRVLEDPVALGGAHLCTLSGGTARCRGTDERFQRSGSVGAPVLVSLAAGLSHTCGLTGEGGAYCWGANDEGQLGNGSSSDAPRAAAVEGTIRFSSLAAGATHTCGLSREGTIFCWGGNLSGQLGDGRREDRTVPRPLAAPGTFRAVTAGWRHSCGLDDGGRTYCWGENRFGQLGDGSQLDRSSPVLVRRAPRMTDIVAGMGHTCGLGDGAVYCWGNNARGQLGDGTTTGRSEANPVTGLGGSVRQVVAGAMHTCALDGGGRAWCWGQNLHGQLGDGTFIDQPEPVAVEGGVRFVTLEAGGGMTCGRTAEGSLYCWGFNYDGQVGDGTRARQPEPRPVPG